MNSLTVYTNAEQLMCCEFPNLKRTVGVTVYDRIANHASLGDAVQVYFERVALNTTAAGGWKSVADAPAEAARMNQYVIEDLDRVIAELQAHRDRLASRDVAADVAALLKS